VIERDKLRHRRGDVEWLKSCFQKLLLNFTWWVNRKDRFGRNVFEGGFLGLDNIGSRERDRRFALTPARHAGAFLTLDALSAGGCQFVAFTHDGSRHARSHD